MASPEPTVIGRYEVVSRLGQGGMGSLYLAKDPKIGRLVAIKLVRQEFDSPEARQRFAREAQSAGTLRHPNIVTIFDVDEHEGLPFIAMEYIDGETLAEIVKRKALLPISKRIQWIEDLCSGLAYAHRQGVIHRDIKPANLMVDNEGTLKILDFGLARRDASKFTQSHVIIGTPNYMSPEQIRGGNIDTRSDIFAVGALFYEILAYKEAFPGAVHQTMHKILHEEPEPLESHVPDLDPAISKILSRALVKDRDGRYADLSAMKNDLSEVRFRIESGPASTPDAATMPMGRDARFSPPSGTQRTKPASSSGTRKASPHASMRYQTNRQSLQRRRSEQISTFLDEARRLFESGDLDKARDKCDEALMFDPDHPGGLQLMDDIAIEADRRQVAAWIAEARAEMQKGQLDSAEALVAQARQVAPESADVQQLQEAIDTTRREIERTRQIQETMRRARTRFAEGGFEAAIRAAGEVLAMDPENAQAKDLQKRAQEAIEHAATREERDAAAQAAVASARKLFESGDKDGAIKELQAFTPKHDLVSAFLAKLKGEKVHDPEPAPRTVSRAGGETAHILRQARGPTENLPARRNFLVIAGAFTAIVLVLVVGYFAYGRPGPPSSPQNQPAASADPAPPANTTAAAQPAILPPEPAPAPVPAALTDKPTQTQDDKDILAAFDFLNKGQIQRAQSLASAVLKRNPGHPSLVALTTSIESRVVAEKERADAVAKAAVAAAALEEEKKKSLAALRDPDPPPAAATNSSPVLTVAPGGAFIAPSAPPSPALLGEVERPALDKAIQQWAAAFQKLDVNALSQIRALTPDELKRWQNTFRTMGRFRMNVRITGTPQVIDVDALVPVEEHAEYAQKGNNQPTLTMQPFRTNYRLKKIGGEWKLLVPSTPMPPTPSQQ